MENRKRIAGVTGDLPQDSTALSHADALVAALSVAEVRAIMRDRISKRVRVTETGCHLWIGATRKRYAQTRVIGAGVQSVHRVTWMLANGPIPSGLEIDHLCHNTLCVNADHLEAVTRAVNIERRTRRNQRDQCIRGHDWDVYGAVNRRGDNSWRLVCRECERQRAQAKRDSAGVS